jgi:hypothetical protein
MYTNPLHEPGRQVDDGWARAIRHGPSTVAEVLERASSRMDEEDRAEEYARDPLAYIGAHRPRTRLIDRLLHGKGRR